MVYIKKWPQFQAQCFELYQRSPEKTRYSIKATPSQTWLVLKVTDDTTCLKYKSRSSIILNRFEAFTKDMTASMAGLPLPSKRIAPAATQDTEMKFENSKATNSNTTSAPSSQNQAKSNTSTAPAGGGGSGAKKKKGKKGGKK